MVVAVSNAPDGETRRGWMWARLAALLALVAATWLLARSDALPHVTLCLFQRVTGKPCPGCGMTRSMLALARGDFVESLRMHPLGVAFAAGLLAAIGGTLVGIVRGGDPPRRFLERHGVRLVVALLVLFLAQWIVRAFVVPSWAPEPVELSR